MSQCGVNFLLFIMVCVVLIFSVLSYVYFGRTYNSSKDLPYDFLIELANNWKTNVITDVVSTSSFTCPEGYSNIIANQWPGTNPGCICGGMYMHTGSCGDNGKTIDKTCVDVKGISSIPYQTWNNNRICVKRGNTDYFSLRIYQQDCPTTLPKKCGKIDTMGNVLCVASNDNCPVSDIKIMDKNVFYNTSILYKSAFLDDKKVLFTQQGGEGYMPIIVKISEKTPCIDPAYENYHKGVSYYLDYFFSKDSCSNLVNGNLYDKYFQQIDTYEYSKVLRENGIFNFYSKLQKYPYFPQDRFSYSSGLYSRGYYGVKFYCMDILKNNFGNLTIITDFLKQTGEDAKKFHVYLGLDQPVVIIQLIVVIIWFMVIAFKNFSSEEPGMIGSLAIVLSIIALVMSLIAFGFVLDAETGFGSNIEDNLSAIRDCADDTIAEFIDKFLYINSYMEEQGTAAAILLIINAVLIILEMIIYKKCKTYVEGNSENGEVLEVVENNGVTTTKKLDTSVKSHKNHNEGHDINKHKENIKLTSADAGEDVKLKSKIIYNDDKGESDALKPLETKKSHMTPAPASGRVDMNGHTDNKLSLHSDRKSEVKGNAESNRQDKVKEINVEKKSIHKVDVEIKENAFGIGLDGDDHDELEVHMGANLQHNTNGHQKHSDRTHSNR